MNATAPIGPVIRTAPTLTEATTALVIRDTHLLIARNARTLMNVLHIKPVVREDVKIRREVMAAVV